MPDFKEPRYNFNDPLFKQRPFLVRLAKDHLSLAGMKSKVIDWEVVRTTDLDIPVTYNIHYHFKSIIGIDEQMAPIFGDHHIAEMSLQRPYPLEPCKVYMKTDLWHPNIKWDGRLKGRVCSNVDKLGIAFDLYGLVLWVAEILQYKNYHALNEPPFPEDITVAEWVLKYAEPNGIIDKNKGIFVDETSLLAQETKPSTSTAEQKVMEPALDPPAPTELTVLQAPVQMGHEQENQDEKTGTPTELQALVSSQAAIETVPISNNPEPLTLDEKIGSGKLKITVIKKQVPEAKKIGSISIKPRG